MEEEIERTRAREAHLTDKWRKEEEERAAREEKEKESAAKVARENSLTRVLLESYYYLTRALLEP